MDYNARKNRLAYLKIMAKGDKNMPKNANICGNIDFYNLEAVKQDINDWVDARLLAMDYQIPDWTDLIRVYEDVMVDGHVNGLINSIKNKIKAKPFEFINQSGENNEYLTKMFDKSWFYQFVDWIIESDFYPYSVVQLGDWVNERFENQKLIPREYIIPQHNLVKQNIWQNIDSKDGFIYTDPNYEPYTIYIGSVKFLGLLDSVAPHALGKKYMLQYWWRYAEKHGLPIRVGKTDIKDPKRRDNMDNMMKNMGNDLWAVMDTDDEYELLSSGSNSDIYNLFLENLKFSNNEITKNIAGAVGIFDEKSFVGSSEAGERLFEEFIIAYSRKVRFTVNDELLPRMINSYNCTELVNYSFDYVNDQKVSYDQNIEMIKTLSPYYNLDADEIKRKTGFTVEEKEINRETPQQAQSRLSVMNEVSDIYKKAING